MAGEEWLYGFEELSREHNDLVGKKCAKLGELTRMGMRVPAGFALSVDAYQRFLSETGAEQEIRSYVDHHVSDALNLSQLTAASEGIRKIVESKEVPGDMAALIVSRYLELTRKSGTPDMAVSVRSAGPVSHPGQYETYLNVKGAGDLLDKVIKIWSSSFNPRSLAYRVRKALPLGTDPIGIAVLGMINARAAGVTLTADPNTGDLRKIICEANWGLGESVVSGRSTPDSFVLDKQSLDILQRKLGDKEFCILCTEMGVTEEEVPLEKRSCYCLSDEEVKEVAHQGKSIENYFNGIPQDIEWAISDDFEKGNSLFFLQTRPAIIAEKKSVTDTILDMVMSRKS
jgi:pyruvate,water dikinase